MRGIFGKKAAVWIDLLTASEEQLFQSNPDELIARTGHLKPGQWVVIDEVQKAPKILDLVHKLIEEKKLLFAMSGSSARKLKRGGANLLAGRAFVYNLFPFTSAETGKDFDLGPALEWGMLPKVLEFEAAQDKKKFLQAYADTYMREEIQIEQIVRNLPAFRRFIDVAAQMNGQPVNYLKVARDIRSDHSVVKNYYGILEDTLLGFSLPAYAVSIRKQTRKAPKFYLFDTGIKRALDKTLELPLHPKTYEYGQAFEHYLILEMHKLCKYREKDETLFYIRTKGGHEIDLVVTRPGKTTLYLEIKSTSSITMEDCAYLLELTAGIKNSDAFVISRDQNEKTFKHVRALHWQKFIGMFSNNEF
ncbi:MAG: hypothetical protein A2583_03735 [Bdellovibrionales bacterium RIFOXYD1_FULL_53_11]|nr:MAG: hypothetical protein A2583_03735 [Bdellovibrionales bacterium RIFOXYD1_FULL_53_11]